MTEKQINDRLKINNLDIYEEYYNQGRSIVVLGMHYNNWEWSGSMQRFIKSQFLVVYNPVRKNKKVERFILDTRERFGAISVPVNLAIRTAQPVIMHHTRKLSRGRYEVFHYKLIENPSEYTPEEIMMVYVKKLEEIIQAEPEYWLWSHRRWKHKRPAGVELFSNSHRHE